ncbi:MAG: c-type cytochrome [Oligoflexus sp.]|jgi:hypothetical protein
MKRLWKWTLLLTVWIIGTMCLGGVSLYLYTEQKLAPRWSIEVPSFSIPRDPSAVEEGRRLLTVKACHDCHSLDFGGKTFIEALPIGRFSGTNLTRGQGSAIKDYDDLDWIRAIRHGLNPDGQALRGMPSDEFQDLTQADLGRMIAALQALPPVDRQTPPQIVGPMARLLLLFDEFPLLLAAERINHQKPLVTDLPPESSIVYGAYLSAACKGCHGSGFAGGSIPGVPPEWPQASNLTPAGRSALWSLDEFKIVLRQGVTPEGHQIDPRYMPWQATRAMTDIEIEALYKFFRSLPARADGLR